MIIIKTLFLCIFLFGLHSAKAIDFERDWERYKGVSLFQERLHQYLKDTASAEPYKPNFENLSPDLFKSWLNPLFANKAQRPAFRPRHLLELFTNLHDSMPDSAEKHRLSDIQHYWMSSQNRHMPLSATRIAENDEQKAMVNALDRRVNSLIGQHYIDATGDPGDIFQIIIGELADSYLGKAASSDNLRHRKHYKICYLISALMVLEKLLGVPLDTLPRARDIIFARFSEKAEDSIIQRAKTLANLADKTQAPFNYKPYLERSFDVHLKTDTVPVTVLPPPVRVLPPMPRPTITASAEPLRSFDDLAAALSSFSGLPDAEKRPMETAFDITEYKAIKQMIALKNQGNPEAVQWFGNYGRNYKALYPALFVETPMAMPMPKPPSIVPRAPVVSEDDRIRAFQQPVQAAIRHFINSSRSGDAARNPGDRRERVRLRDLKETELIEYENGADGDCGLFVLGIDREEALKTLRNGTFKVLPVLIDFGEEDEVRQKARRELSTPKESVSADVLISIAYTFGKNASIWDQSGAHLFVCEEHPGQTLQIVFVDANRGSGHYARLVPVNDIKARIWAKTVEDHVEKARSDLERLEGFDITEAEANYVRAQYFPVEAALNEFAEKISQTLPCPKATALALINK